MSLTLSVYALFILFMKLVNGAQCLNCANSAPVLMLQPFDSPVYMYH